LKSTQAEAAKSAAEIRTAGLDIGAAVSEINTAGAKTQGETSVASHDASFYGSPSSDVYCSGDGNDSLTAFASIAAAYSVAAEEEVTDELVDDDEMPLFSKRATMFHVDANNKETVSTFDICI